MAHGRPDDDRRRRPEHKLDEPCAAHPTAMTGATRAATTAGPDLYSCACTALRSTLRWPVALAPTGAGAPDTPSPLPEPAPARGDDADHLTTPRRSADPRRAQRRVARLSQASVRRGSSFDYGSLPSQLTTGCFTVGELLAFPVGSSGRIRYLDLNNDEGKINSATGFVVDPMSGVTGVGETARGMVSNTFEQAVQRTDRLTRSRASGATTSLGSAVTAVGAAAKIGTATAKFLALRPAEHHTIAPLRWSTTEVR